MTQSVTQRCGKIAWHWNTSTLLGQPGVKQWTTTWECPLHRDKFLAGLEMNGLTWNWVKVGFSHIIVQVFLNCSSIAFSKMGWIHAKCDKPAQRNPSCSRPARRVSLLQVQKARPVGAGCLLFTFELRDLLRMHSPGHIALQRGSFLKHFSSYAVARILVALSHSCLLCTQHHSLLLLPSGLDSSYLN